MAALPNKSPFVGEARTRRPEPSALLTQRSRPEQPNASFEPSGDIRAKSTLIRTCRSPAPSGLTTYQRVGAPFAHELKRISPPRCAKLRRATRHQHSERRKNEHGRGAPTGSLF